MKLFNRQKTKPARKDNLKAILRIVDDVSKTGNDVKVFHTKHNMLISTCIELMVKLPLDEQKIVREIVEKCRY